jgi:hypothetical protein
MTTISTEMLAALQDLIDKDAIKDVLARYSRGIDRADGDLAELVYHPDAIDDHGEFKGLGRDFARIPRIDPRWTVSCHTLGQSLIDIDGDVAHSETYCIYHYERYDHDRAADRAGIIVCRYFDRFERRDSEWRIAFRRVLYEYSHEHDPMDTWPNHEAFNPSRRSRDDDVYHPDRLHLDPSVLNS